MTGARRGFAYEVWDVFTDRAFGGNPLAVFADARGLDGGAMQRIAREFNLSETTFVLPPETAGGTARMRIFTPSSELPFAGHPTIGTAIALAERGDAFGRGVGSTLVLEEGIGPIRCTMARSDGIWRATLTTETPFQRLGDVDPATAAACLGLPESALRSAAHPPLIASKGLPFVIVELTDIAALDAALPDLAALRAATARFPATAGHFDLVPYVRVEPGAVHMRMFAPLAGIPEDPATGSAAAALGALVAEIDGAPTDLTITQGAAMGRPSTIRVRAEGRGGRSVVHVGGTAVRVMRGTLDLPVPA